VVASVAVPLAPIHVFALPVRPKTASCSSWDSMEARSPPSESLQKDCASLQVNVSVKDLKHFPPSRVQEESGQEKQEGVVVVDGATVVVVVVVVWEQDIPAPLNSKAVRCVPLLSPNRKAA